jgi:hypothetical protein
VSIPILSARRATPSVLTPAQRVADAWRLYLKRTRRWSGIDYEQHEPVEWRRLKGRLAEASREERRLDLERAMRG